MSPIPCRRNYFHPAFTRWAISTGEPFIRTLRWALPYRDAAIERTRHAIRCAASASQVKIAEALTGLGVPFNTSHGPTWGSGFTDWKVARQLFHKPCACDLPYVHSSTSAFSRCLRCHGYSMQGDPLSKLFANHAEEARTSCALHVIMVSITCLDVV